MFFCFLAPKLPELPSPRSLETVLFQAILPRSSRIPSCSSSPWSVRVCKQHRTSESCVLSREYASLGEESEVLPPLRWRQSASDQNCFSKGLACTRFWNALFFVGRKIRLPNFTLASLFAALGFLLRSLREACGVARKKKKKRRKTKRRKRRVNRYLPTHVRDLRSAHDTRFPCQWRRYTSQHIFLSFSPYCDISFFILLLLKQMSPPTRPSFCSAHFGEYFVWHETDNLW